MIFDFDDEDIRDMVRIRHTPTEKWRSPQTLAEAKAIIGVICDVCEADWPCSPVRELREWQRTELEKISKMTPRPMRGDG